MELRELREGFEEFNYDIKSSAASMGEALKAIASRLRKQKCEKKEKETGVIDLYKSYESFDEFENSLMNMELEELKYEDIAGRENDKPYYF